MNFRYASGLTLYLGLFLGAGLPAAAAPVYQMPLRRNSVPVYRNGVIKSYKTAYHGEVAVGSPPQKFSVLFDTGSAQVILPAAECAAHTCQKHARYDASKSVTARHVNEDGTAAADSRNFAGADRDRTRVRFGTGEVEGGFVRDRLCLDATSALESIDLRVDCAEVHVIGAYHMSEEPFYSFGFDGIIGLGLSSLALTPDFSFFSRLSAGLPSTALPHFGVYIAKAEDELSEISFGGSDPARMASPTFWSKVVNEQMGHWQIGIKRVTINGEPWEKCEAGDCLAIVDTGCTALGVPKSSRPWIFDKIAQKVEGSHPEVVCKDVPAPEIVFDLGGFTVTLDNKDYFKRRALVVDGHMRPEIDGVVQAANEVAGEGISANEAPRPRPPAAGASQREAEADFERRAAERFTVCQPALVPVPVAPPLTDKIFILGEPVLKKYYTDRKSVV